MPKRDFNKVATPAWQIINKTKTFSAKTSGGVVANIQKYFVWNNL